MGTEAYYTGRQVKVEPDGTVIIINTKVGTRKVVDEAGAPRKGVDNGKQKKTEKAEFPEGAIKSLKPLLRQIFDNGYDDEAHWAKVVAEAPMGVQDAVNRLRAAGKSHEEAARELITSDPTGFENSSWGRLTELQIEEKITEMAEILLPLYQNK